MISWEDSKDLKEIRVIIHGIYFFIINFKMKNLQNYKNVLKTMTKNIQKKYSHLNI